MPELTFNLVRADIPLNKHYRKVDGKIESQNIFPMWWQGIKGYTKGEITLELIEEILVRALSENIAVLPNLPINYQGGEFRRKKELLTNHKRNWVQFDIDWKEQYKVPSEILKGGLEKKASYVLKRLGLPDDLGYVAQYSSSAHIKGNTELRIRLWLLLSNALDECGLKTVFRELDVDPALFLRGTVHYLKPATADRNVPIFDLPEPTILKKSGCFLDVGNIEASDYPDMFGINVSSATKKSTWSLSSLLFDYFKTKSIPWSDWNKIDAALIYMANQGQLEGKRNRIHFELLREDFLRNGYCYRSIATIVNNKQVLGAGWTNKDVLKKADDVRAYFFKKWGCGDIAKSFNPDQIKEVSCYDLSQIQEEIKSWLPETGIVVVKSGCGSGKTQSVIRTALSRFTGSRRLSICFRKAVLKQQADELGFTYYLDAGKDMPDAVGLSEADRKKQFLPQYDNPAVTIQSLKYLLKGGRFKPFDIVIIDEVEHVIEELFVEPQIRGNNNEYASLSNDFHILMNICSQAKLVILADDKASDILTGWFAREISRWNETKVHLLLNDKDYIQNMSFTMLSSEVEAVMTIVRLVSEGKKVAVQTAYGNRDDKPDIDRLVSAIRQLTGLRANEVLGWHSGSFPENTPKDNVRDTPNKSLPRLIDNGLKVAIFSPVNSVGWSYFVPHPDYVFDAVVNIYDWIGIPALDIKQGTRRWRLTEVHWVYITAQQKRIAEDAVEDGFVSEGFIEISNPFSQLQKNLHMAHTQRLESVRAHFVSHIEELGGGICQNIFKFSDIERATTKKALKSSNCQVVQDGLKRIKESKDVLEHFSRLSLENGEVNLNHISLDELSDQQLRKMHKSMQQLTLKKALNLVELWFLSPEERRLLKDEEEAAFYYLHGQLLDAVNDVLSPCLPDGIIHFLQWLVADENPSLEFHIENTDSADAFRAFVKNHQAALKISAFTELKSGNGWQESPFKVIEAICKSLFLEVKKKEKLSGLRNGKQIAVECKKALIEEYVKEKKIKKSMSDKTKKKILTDIVIQKRAQRKTLSETEKAYYDSIGKRFEIRKSVYVPKVVYQEILSIYYLAEEDIYDLCI